MRLVSLSTVVMPRKVISRVVRAGLLAGLGLAVACGADDIPPAHNSLRPSPDDASRLAVGCDEPVVVSIADFAFSPDVVTVPAGCDVVWRNDHDQAHTSSGSGAQRWSTGSIDPGATSEPVPFPDAGDLTYRCAFHPFMTGTVTVEG
jgi:plastocyanin